LKGGLWFVRLLLIFVVGVVVLSPLAVHGEASAPQPMRLDYDTSGLLLPSSPVYPAVSAYRDVRMSLAEQNTEKSDLSLEFANQDAVSISELVQKQDYVTATKHCATYQNNFDRSVGWLVIAAERGSDVSLLLGRLKNDHLSQQWVLGEAAQLLPEWSGDAIDVARRHAATVLAQALASLEGNEAVVEYQSALAAMSPEPGFFESMADREMPVVQTPSLAFASAPATEVSPAPSVVEENVVAVGPDIASLSVSPDTVAPKGTCRVTCNVICDDEASLEYTWWCSKGAISSDGSDARWTAPSKPGTYQLRVTVMDGNGAGDAQSINVSVKDDEEEDEANEGEDDDSIDSGSDAPAQGSSSPDILGVSVTADHKYLEQSMAGYSILVDRDCTIKCEVADTDGITFTWTASRGEIVGSGDTVKWLAPHAVGNFTVTVTARNGKGQEDSVTLTFHVTTCSQCF
jgi:hypothetical protein